MASLESAWVARQLREAAELVQAQGGNAFRIAAYRKAAASVENCGEDLRKMISEHGPLGLARLPGIGAGLASAIARMLETGRFAMLERLHGELDAESLFQTVPGIGPELAQRIHEALDVETLEALEVACHDGRLQCVPGVGVRRAAMIGAALAKMLDRRPGYAIATTREPEPAVDVLLDVDREYRSRAGAGSLPRIAPRRFNPDGLAWLPILHVQRGQWHFTALFSNTARAHRLGRTHDWVVLYFDSDHHGERRRTIVSESRGALAGRRVVRGRERECAVHYEQHGDERSMSLQAAAAT